jgi:DNA (cytosine-5)-methyltransferase 1
MALSPFYHLDLCSGSGMLGLALKIALGGNLQTLAYIERETYAAATLVARMADATLDRAPIWDDVKTASSPKFVKFIRQFRPLILSGGYPCQPFSCAGKRAGANDERHLWPWIDKLIGQVLPEICFFENVPGHVSLGFAQVRRDLQDRGYRVQAGIFSAEEVGASHRRERLYILALRDPLGHTEGGQCGQTWSESNRCGGTPPVDRASGSVANSTSARSLSAPYPGVCCGETISGLRDEQFERFHLPLFAPAPGDLEQWEFILHAMPHLTPAVEPELCRTPDGVAYKLDADRLRLIGNGVVPLAAAYAFIALYAALQV